MILYMLLFLTTLVILFFAYIRLKYRFWALQPVFHFYNIYYWFVDKGVIEEELPEKNKYFNPQIKTITYGDVDENQIIAFLDVIHNHYIASREYKENKFTPAKENVVSYFIGHNAPCYWSFYYENMLTQQNSSTTDIIEKEKLISIMTGRPLHVEIIKPNINMDVYYIDYLCVDQGYRKKGIAPQMIQTHEYNQRHLNKNIVVSLFKREDELTGIIPLCAYDSYGYTTCKWLPPQELSAEYIFLLCDQQNIYYLMDFIKSCKSEFDIFIISDVGNIIELVKTQNIFVYMLMRDDIILAAYFFRKTCTYVKEGEEVLSCFATLNKCPQEKVFIHAFKIACYKIKEKYTTYQYLIVENISSSCKIIKNLNIKTQPLISKTAYFFYNFAYHTFDSEKTFIFC
jgi:hypothetical protein